MSWFPPIPALGGSPRTHSRLSCGLTLFPLLVFIFASLYFHLSVTLSSAGPLFCLPSLFLSLLLALQEKAVLQKKQNRP